jgi:parvulin-like peptidyl-prolyl isomerase
MARMNRWLKEPLLHFLLAGGLLFAAYARLNAPGQWHGPLASGYGVHLVRVDARQAGQERPFAEVRAQALDEWQREQQEKAGKQFFARLLKKYDVIVEDSVKPLIGPLKAGVK